METLINALPLLQAVLSVVLIVLILLQRSGSGIGGAFGSDNFSAGFSTRRGVEKKLFDITIGVAVLFVISAFIQLFV